MPAPGGELYDPKKFHDDVIRAELCALASACCYRHGARMVDEILRNYHITPKFGRLVKT